MERIFKIYNNGFRRSREPGLEYTVLILLFVLNFRLLGTTFGNESMINFYETTVQICLIQNFFYPLKISIHHSFLLDHRAVYYLILTLTIDLNSNGLLKKCVENTLFL